MQKTRLELWIWSNECFFRAQCITLRGETFIGLKTENILIPKATKALMVFQHTFIKF